ncbi:hypothetical protein I4F81_009413 [Pyropia yezoensis]|uniref:Uncharacterized protein n=1 Tax=Pyropia yezoensis TaxID=2788 RepID=A0ACC3CAW0_PYRYE|nr:hypothetical protein I4F81_009413 [Neopyropia yezoensis]
MADAAFVAAAGAAADGLGEGGAADSDDELDEVEDFGAGAIAADRLAGEAVPEVGALDFETDCAERAARRASSQNAASFAMSEKSWASADSAAARFIRFLARAYAIVNAPGGETAEQQGLRFATTLDAALPHRLRRYFALLRKGGRAHLVGGKNAPLAMSTVCNVASCLRRFFALACRDFAGETSYVPGCKSADDAYMVIPEVDRTPSQIAAGETFQGCPLKHSIVVEWLQGSHKRATSLGEEAAQTPPVTVETMTAACDLATVGFDDPDAEDDPTALQYRRLTLYIIMVFSWCTMLRPVNLLGLTCIDVEFAPMVGQDLLFFETYGRPRWAKIRYSRLKTNVAGTAPAPAYYFWSADSSQQEMEESAHSAGASACVRCPFSWCDLPAFAYLYIQLRAADPGFTLRSELPFFVTPVPGDVDGGGAMSGVPVTKAWWELHLRAFVLLFDPALSARGVGGLYGFRRGATQFWLNLTGDVQLVMRMGVWKANSSRFLFYVLNYRCRGTLRARIRHYDRVDREDFQARLGALVDGFMLWFEARVVALHAENHGNFFAAAFGAEVAGKVLEMVSSLLHLHGDIEGGGAV